MEFSKIAYSQSLLLLKNSDSEFDPKMQVAHSPQFDKH